MCQLKENQLVHFDGYVVHFADIVFTTLSNCLFVTSVSMNLILVTLMKSIVREANAELNTRAVV